MKRKYILFLIVSAIIFGFSSCANTVYRDSVKDEEGERVIYMPAGKQVQGISCTGNAHIPIIWTKDASDDYEPQTYEMYEVSGGDVYLSYIIKEH